MEERLFDTVPRTVFTVNKSNARLKSLRLRLVQYCIPLSFVPGGFHPISKRLPILRLPEAVKTRKGQITNERVIEVRSYFVWDGRMFAQSSTNRQAVSNRKSDVKRVVLHLVCPI